MLWLQVIYERESTWKCVENSSSVSVSKITFELFGIFRRGLHVLESTHPELEFEQKFCILSMEIKSLIVVWKCLTVLPEIRIPVMCRQERVKMEVKRFNHKFGLEIFFLYRGINHLKMKFWVKNSLVASYSLALIDLKTCGKLIFGNCLEDNFGTVWNF